MLLALEERAVDVLSRFENCILPVCRFCLAGWLAGWLAYTRK